MWFMESIVYKNISSSFNIQKTNRQISEELFVVLFFVKSTDLLVNFQVFLNLKY